MIHIAKSVYSDGWSYKLPEGATVIKVVMNTTDEGLYEVLNNTLTLTNAVAGYDIEVYYAIDNGYYKYGQLTFTAPNEIHDEVIVFDEPISASDARITMLLANGSAIEGIPGVNILVMASNYPFSHVGLSGVSNPIVYHRIWATLYPRGADAVTGVIAPEVQSVFDIIDGPVTAVKLAFTAPSVFPSGVTQLTASWCFKR